VQARGPLGLPFFRLVTPFTPFRLLTADSAAALLVLATLVIPRRPTTSWRLLRYSDVGAHRWP
jgi:hypothetical protein